jgi:hypothetical protein
MPTCILMADPAVETAKPHYRFKAVFNDRGIVLGPATAEHKTLCGAGIAYVDDERGNAVAALVSGGRLEIRRHAAFSPDRIQGILRRLEALPQLAPIRGFQVANGGRPLGTFGAKAGVPGGS